MFTSTCIRIQIEVAVHAYTDSLSVRQLICKAILSSSENFNANLLQRLFHCQNCPTKHYFARLTCLRRPIRPSDIERSFKISSRRLP